MLAWLPLFSECQSFWSFKKGDIVFENPCLWWCAFLSSECILTWKYAWVISNCIKKWAFCTPRSIASILGMGLSFFIVALLMCLRSTFMRKITGGAFETIKKAATHSELQTGRARFLPSNPAQVSAKKNLFVWRISPSPSLHGLGSVLKKTCG